MKFYNQFNKSLLVLLQALCFMTLFVFSACDDDNDPVKENAEEAITKVILTFTPAQGSPVVVTATDPDGVGIQDVVADDEITLSANQTYELSIQLLNELADENAPEYNVTEEVREEGDEHMFFFGWTNEVFSAPTGNGNIDNRGDDVNYSDEDDNGLPLGLKTSWTATAAPAEGTFTLLLKHQPDNAKSESSTSSDGETDLNLTFDIVIE